MASTTIRDVARYAGVGVATVSRVINDNPNVREGTRARVLDAIKQLNYIPNVAARQLSGGKTLVIGIVTPYVTLPAFSERLAGIQTALWNSQYDIVLHSVRSPANLEGKLTLLLSQHRVDGLILITPPKLSDDLWQANPDMPIVVLDGLHLRGRYPTILIDDKVGGQLAAHYLLSKGHVKIGFVGDQLESVFGVTSNKYRFDGFLSTLREGNAPIQEAWHCFGEITSNVARQHAREILSLPDRPTAIFASSDVKAFDVLNVAEEMGLRVPEDLAVVGFDDIEAAHYMKLTTVRQHLRDTGKQAADLLLSWLQSETPPKELNYLRTVDIVERQTV